MPVRVMKLIGIENLIVTNAAGGLNPSFRAGDVMLVKDHINMPGFTGMHPLRGPNDGRFGGRFFALNDCYDKDYRIMAKKIHQSMEENAPGALHEGVYAMLGGPNFETVAELRMLKVCGVDAVGKFLFLLPFNLFVTSKNESTNSPIHEFKVLQNFFKIKKQGSKCFLQ